ncbi:MAG: chromate efflux transporter [Planktomarina sp.]
MQSLQNFGQLFKIFARIGLLSFGGPAAQIALMQTELVDRHKIISQDAFLRALSFCMLLPGPEAMQLATYIGWQRAGVWGGLMAGSLFVLPGAVFIAVMAAIYIAFGQVPLVQNAFVGIQAVVILIVFQALWKVSKRAFHGRMDIIVASLAFCALFFLHVPFPVVIICALIFGAFRGHAKPTITVPTSSETHGYIVAIVVALLWLVPLAALVVTSGFYGDLATFFSKLATVTFGGAYAVLAYMTQTAVQDCGWVTTDQMVDALGLAETTPGPLILVTQFVGMLAGYAQYGWTGALWAGIITLYMTFVPCFLWIFAFAPHLERIMGNPRVAAALATVTAAVVGVVANLSVWFSVHVFFAWVAPVSFGHLHGFTLSQPQFIAMAITLGFAVFVRFKPLPLPLLIACAALLGAGVANI